MNRKIILRAKHCEDREYYSIGDLAQQRLNGEDYDRGILEAVEATAKNNSIAIGRLLETLVGLDKGVLQLSDVCDVLGYGEDVTLILGERSD